MAMPNARRIINKINTPYDIYKFTNFFCNIFSIAMSYIFCYGIYEICISENIYRNMDVLFGCIAFLIITIVASYKFYKLRKLKCKDEIYDIIIDYLKTVYVYIAYAEIKKISFFDIMDILLVYRNCLELKILDDEQLNNVNYIIEDLKSKSDL